MMNMTVLTTESIISHQDTADIPVLMLANKQDLPTSLKVEEIQQAGFTRIAEALSARDSKVLPISALTGYILAFRANDSDGVKDAIDWLYARLRSPSPQQ
jgi:ADP-ribosylation factor related protein 1